MKNCIKLLPVVFLFIWAVSMPSAASARQKEVPARHGHVSMNGHDRQAVISETGEARDYFRPDIAIITLGVETEEKTAAEAVTENARKAGAIVTVLKGLINPAKGDSIKTSSFSLQPVYEYDTVSRRLRGYMARNLVTVRTKEIETAGRIIDDAVRSGANTVQDLSFTLSDEKKFCDGVLKKAAEQAKKEATYVARLLDTEIAGVKSISSSCGSEVPRPVYGSVLASKAVKAAVPETAIESGDIAVTATVSVVFRLRQGLQQ
jgi:uncharacterized protein